jgi:hypothetical protein
MSILPQATDFMMMSMPLIAGGAQAPSPTKTPSAFDDDDEEDDD